MSLAEGREQQDRLAGDEAITLHGTLAGKWSFESLIDPCGPSETDRLVAQAVHVCLAKVRNAA